MDRDQFMKKYKITEEDFLESGLSWDVLMDIYKDYLCKRPMLESTARFMEETLRKADKVHSIRYRTKDPEHLVEKLIRKKKREANSKNYSAYINDLIGLRVLHIYKEDWEYIHDYILSNWQIHESVTANVRKGDSDSLINAFKSKGCIIKEHDIGYRSVHYIIKSYPTNNEVLAEIQVRTIFEEAWSEIDHDTRYPYDVNNKILKTYLIMYNRLTGTADEMGSFIKYLGIELRKQKETSTNQIEDLKQRLKLMAEEGKDIDTILKELDILKASSFLTGIPLNEELLKHNNETMDFLKKLL